jgi:hypothetical protein
VAVCAGFPGEDSGALTPDNFRHLNCFHGQPPLDTKNIFSGIPALLNGVQEVAGSNPVAPTMAFVPREVMTNGNV